MIIPPVRPLLCFLMKGVFAAETTILLHFQPVGIVLLVFHLVVVALLAFRASQGDLDSHDGTSRNLRNKFSLPHQGKKINPFRGTNTIPYPVCFVKGVSLFLTVLSKTS